MSLIDIKIYKKKNSAGGSGGIGGSGGGSSDYATRAGYATEANSAKWADKSGYAIEAQHAETADNLSEDSPVLQKFIRKDKDDSTPYRLGVGSLKTNNFISGLMGGIGAGIDERGNAEFESAVIRTALTVMELVVNRQSVMAGDQIYSEGGTIEAAEYASTNADGTQQWLLTIHEEYVGAACELQPGMVLRGVVNNLLTAANSGTPAMFYTSWMRVNGPELGTSGHTLSVTLYPDSETPAGKNYPPCELMKLARWGHVTNPDYQRLFILSSHDGTLRRYEGIDRPIISSGNLGSLIGRCPAGLFDGIADVTPGEEIAYFKKIIGTFIHVDHLGNPIEDIMDTGEYDPERTYHCRSFQSQGYITEDCWYKGCRWRCMSDGITGVTPGYGIIQWAFVSGNPEFKVDFAEKVIAYNESELATFGATLTLTATLYNQDVLGFIPASNIQWGRESYDRHGALRAASDAAWTPTTDNGNKRLLLTASDLDYDGTPISRIIFWARVALDDTNVQLIGAEFS